MNNDKVYRVVEITSEHDLVINAGSNDSICEEMQFEIFVYGKEIIDPVTNESLGTLDIIKETVEVINVYPKMCRCKAIIYKTEPSVVLGVASYLQPKEVAHAKKLNIDYEDISPNIEIETKKIKVGDMARLKN